MRFPNISKHFRHSSLGNLSDAVPTQAAAITSKPLLLCLSKASLLVQIGILCVVKEFKGEYMEQIYIEIYLK